MSTAPRKQIDDPSSIVALEAVLKSRFGWADGVVSPFAVASHHEKFRGYPRRRLSKRAMGSDLRGIPAARK